MIAQVLQRLNRREQILAGLVALVVFFLANLFLWSWLFRAIGDSQVEVAKRKQARNEQTVLLRESDLWSKREQWLREHQPVFHGASDASALLDQLKQVAGKYSVSVSFCLYRNEKSVAAAGSFSLRRASARCFHCL